MTPRRERCQPHHAGIIDRQSQFLSGTLASLFENLRGGLLIRHRINSAIDGNG
jgi:hypothetical protein